MSILDGGGAFPDKTGSIGTNVRWAHVNHLRLVSRSTSQTTLDQDCLDAFLRELGYVHRSFRLLGAMSFDVEDLSQDLFVALRRSWSEYDPNRPLRPYLFGFAFRIAASYKRKRRRAQAVMRFGGEEEDPGPEEALQSMQDRALLLAALNRIPLPRRAVLVLHELDEVPVEEVASVLGIPRFTVYSRLRKARRELQAAVRRLLRKGGGE